MMADDQFDKETRELFPAELDKAVLTRVVKKARRHSIIKTVLISAATSVVVVVGYFLLNAQLLNFWTNNLYSYSSLANQISEPNVSLGDYHFSGGLFGGQFQLHTYKMIDGVPIPWTTQSYTYNIFSGYSRMFGNYSPSPQIPTQNGMRPYNPQTEQREMMFYYPGINYRHYFHDLRQLKNIPRGDRVEMALSFNKAYNYRQIPSMLPKGVHAAWYWVNTFSKQDIRSLAQLQFPMMPYEVYGFGNMPAPVGHQRAQFIQAVETAMKTSGSLQYASRQIYDALSHGKGRIVPADVKIIGVVVTGTPHALMALQGKAFVKASVLGAIANPY